MRSQFISAIEALCNRRTKQSPHIQWWYSETRLPPHRAGCFTHDYSSDDTEVETQEDAPAADEYWYQVETV
jgi:hypothetical protein